MKALGLLLLLAACATAPPPAVCVTMPLVEPAPRAAKMATPDAPAVAAVVARERRLKAEARRYVAWPRSQPQIIDNFLLLQQASDKAFAQLGTARTPAEHKAALAAAESANAAIGYYLQNKGD